MSRVAGAERRQAEAEGGDLPEDMQIGFSGKGSGIFGAFGTPARSARPTPEVCNPHRPSLHSGSPSHVCMHLLPSPCVLTKQKTALGGGCFFFTCGTFPEAAHHLLA